MTGSYHTYTAYRFLEVVDEEKEEEKEPSLYVVVKIPTALGGLQQRLCGAVPKTLIRAKVLCALRRSPRPS